MDNQNEGEEEVVAPEVETEEEATEATEEESKEESVDAYKARLQRAEKKIERLKLEKTVEKKVEAKVKEKTGELDETQLDYLDLKGITEQDDVDLIQKVMLKTGQTVRQALKDDYVQSKLKALQADREVKSATPSSSKRSGSGGSNDLAVAIAKYEQSGYRDLPADFKLRSAVINAVVDKQDTNKPAWHR